MGCNNRVMHWMTHLATCNTYCAVATYASYSRHGVFSLYQSKDVGTTTDLQVNDLEKPLSMKGGIKYVSWICRFDMMHVMIDEPDDDMDVQIATHIVKVHQRRERAFNVPYTMAQVQRYIRYARSIKPQISAQVSLS